MHNGEVPLTVPGFALASTVSVLNDAAVPLQAVTVYVISAVPAPMAVTRPVAGLTVATLVFVLLQLPPASPLVLYVAVAPIHKGEVPDTTPALTFGLTVRMALALSGLFPQPINVYIMLQVPAPTAVTRPVDAFTVATPVFVLLQTPPGTPLLVYVAVAPIHSGVLPLTTPALMLVCTNIVM